MHTIPRRILMSAFKLFDLTLMVFSFALATVPVFDVKARVSFTQFLSMRVKIQNFVLFFGLLIVWHGIFSLFGLYRSRRLSAPRSESKEVIQATSVGTLSIGLAAFLFDIQLVDPLFLVVFWATSSVTVVTSRLILRYFLGRLRTGRRNLRNMLIVGTNPRAVEFARKIEAQPELGYRIMGFVDEEWAGIKEFRKTGYPMIGNFDNFLGFLRNSVVDEVVMALPVKSSYYHASRIAGLCEEQGIIVRLLSNIFNLKMARSRAEEFEGHSLTTLHRTMGEDWPLLVKRILDFSVALVLLILLSPLFLLVALLIKLTSSGPIFFVQNRLGLNKRGFPTYKFRTMVPDAERRQSEVETLNEVSGPVFKIKDDPRLSPLGKFLRRTSIDELPQLINVLKGDMSLVGPRPLPVRDYEGFDQDWQRRRFSVRPGITCLWQINGRSSLPFGKWMELDMEYIDEWSLWLDLKILVRTIPAVFRGSGAI